ncbi:MAG: aspartyl protease family protein [Deltaproteobacteria bacterium]|nr:aspartyl protease family protein [Deltaproteobacteria bacterium]
MPTALLALIAGCALRSGPALTPDSGVVSGPGHAAVDLVRAFPEGDKIFVQVDLGLPDPGLFLVDTGASISVVSPRVAQALHLSPREEDGRIEGIGGSVSWASVVVPRIGLGPVTLRDVAAAVDLQGVPDYAGAVPLDGILGNNVWSRFVLTIDYPADRLELDRAGSVDLPPTAAPMLFDGAHCYTFAELAAGSGPDERASHLLLALDTGSRGILLLGPSGEAFADLATEGEEPLFGIGSVEELPATALMQRTRRVQLSSIALGGERVEGPFTAQWAAFDAPTAEGPAAMPGLVGHAVFAKHRVVLDFPGSRFAVLPSEGPPRSEDGHMRLLADHVRRHGKEGGRGVYRARLKAWLDDWDGARSDLIAHLALHPEDAEARVLLARVVLAQGDVDSYGETLAPLSGGALADHDELLGFVSHLLLTGKKERARTLVDAALLERPDDAEVLVARSEVFLATGDPAEARRLLADANRREESPDGHLLRRARVSLAEGDRMAALSHLHRLLDIYPLSGFSVWFSQFLVQTDEERDALRAALESATGRLHPEDRPYDFMMSLYQTLGDAPRVDETLHLGMDRDCQPLEKEAAKANCEAWYLALADRDLDRALYLATRANALAPNRSDYLDTLSVVRWRRGDLDGALEASSRAAILSSDDVYLVWQRENLSALRSSAQE